MSIFKKKKPSERGAFARLTSYMFKAKWLAAAAVALALAANILSLEGPKLAGKAIDQIKIDINTGKVISVDFGEIGKYCVMMIVFYIFSAGLSYILSNVMIAISQRITRTLRREVFSKLMDLPVGYFDQLQAGDVISRISYDIDTINGSLSNDLLQVIVTITVISITLYYMISISWKMLLVFLITVPFSIGYSIKKSRKVRPLFRKRSKELGLLNGYTEEMLSGLRTIKAYGREKQFHDRYKGKNKIATDATFDADYQSASLGTSVNFINNLSMALISMAGAVFYVTGAISLGNISSFIQYGRRFSGPINEFSNIIADLQSCRSAAERVFAIIDEFPEPVDAPDAKSLPAVRGEVEFSHVKFRYTPEKEIIHDLSVKIPAGTTIAIVGPTGGGKTTIVNLLMRFYDIQYGKITLDGIPIDKIKRSELRKAFTMVLQETWLFNGTIAENIAYGAENATREDIEKAAEKAGIHRFITSLPDGYETVITDGGRNISKGQKQLITIARAMLSDARMLILDEATSNIDTRTEMKISEAMERLMEGRTCFVIAHRLSTVRSADCIMVVKDGDVAEMGTHEELLEKGGFYSELYRAQYK